MKTNLTLSSVFFSVAILGVFSQAHDPLTEELQQQYAADGSLDERKLRIAALRQYRMAENNARRAIYKVRRASLEASGLSPAEVARELTTGPNMAFPFTARPELRSTGEVKTLTILVDFKDNRAATVLPGLTTDTIRENIYGNGTAVAQTFHPHESLHEYYDRASQGLVDVQGNVLGWHQFAKNRKEYEPIKAPTSLPIALRRQQQAMNDNRANFKILSEALDALDATHDFSQYDNDNDGDIDLVTVLYAGAPTGWGSFWWAYRWEFFVSEASSKLFDGKRAKQFVFQFVDTRGPGNTDFDPTTLLHEMGHAFGLADYYDYDSEVGPPGGVGGLDMMHANQGNQNAFSRWLLDWIKPEVIGAGVPIERTLNASGSITNTNKAIAIFPGLAGNIAPEQEMFIVENRHRVGNDANLPGDGFLIWHIDASINADGDDFALDNSFTARKLIKLMRADNAVDFGEFEQATANTYFIAGKSFTPTSSPNSSSYSGTDTHISIDGIGTLGETSTIKIGFLNSSLQPASPSAAPEAPEVLATAASDELSIDFVLTDKSPLDLDTLEDLEEQFAVADSKALASLWTRALIHNKANPGSEKLNVVLKLLASRWASKDGKSAAEAILKLSDDAPLYKSALPLALESWAKNNPSEMANWYLSDSQTLLRERRKGLHSEVLHESFEGLYLTDPSAALDGLRKLSVTSELVNALEGVFHSARKMGQNEDQLSERLEELQLDVVNAHVEVTKALRAAESLIKDPAVRAEFKDVMQQRLHD